MKLFVPNEYHKTIHDIDLVKLYDQGIRLILTDLDNTLVGYDTPLPTAEIIAFKAKVEALGMKLEIISNNNENRVKLFAEHLGVAYSHNMKKPLKKHYRKFLRQYPPHQIAIIGDQIMTDVIGGNRMGFYTILVDCLNQQNELKRTKFNRMIERKILKRYKIKDGGNGEN